MPKRKERSVVERRAVEERMGEIMSLIGERQRVVEEVSLEANQQVEEIKRGAEQKTGLINQEIEALFEQGYRIAEEYYDLLTLGKGRRTIDISSGIFGWRTTPPKVAIDDSDAVIRSIKALGFLEFLRVKEEVDKSAILKSPDKATLIAGIEIVQEEEFVLIPAATDTPVKRRFRKKRRSSD